MGFMYFLGEFLFSHEKKLIVRCLYCMSGKIQSQQVLTRPYNLANHEMTGRNKKTQIISYVKRQLCKNNISCQKIVLIRIFLATPLLIFFLSLFLQNFFFRSIYPTHIP